MRINFAASWFCVIAFAGLAHSSAGDPDDCVGVSDPAVTCCSQATTQDWTRGLDDCQPCQHGPIIHDGIHQTISVISSGSGLTRSSFTKVSAPCVAVLKSCGTTPTPTCTSTLGVIDVKKCSSRPQRQNTTSCTGQPEN